MRRAIFDAMDLTVIVSELVSAAVRLAGG